MARPLRIEFEDAIYHLCARGNERQKVFRDDRDREHFLLLLERGRERYTVSVLGFVHWHAVIETPQPNLSVGMRWLLGTYTQSKAIQDSERFLDCARNGR